MGEELTMSEKELNRLTVCKMLDKGLLSHRKAARHFDLSIRQSKRILKKYRTQGKVGLISGKRGKTSNRSYGFGFKKKIKTIMVNCYPDFGPTFAAEKLKEIHGIKIHKDTLRKYMTEWQLWHPNKKRKYKIHQQRMRREHFGELVQIDGSYHDWFEGRGAKCCLIVYIDDATSEIVNMHFVPTETTQAYFECTKKYIKKHGRPWAFYSDKHSIFRVNKEGSENKETQFRRAMRELDIKTICAHSPQAKGRVERANRTLQDRLIKEMRLRGISNIEEANQYVEEFIISYNKKFGKAAAKTENFHRKIMPSDLALEVILSEQYYRKISNNLEFYFENDIYQVMTDEGNGLRDLSSIICRFANNELKIWHNGNFVECKKFNRFKKVLPVATGKEINEIVDNVVATKAKKLPWKQIPLLRIIEKNQLNKTATI